MRATSSRQSKRSSLISGSSGRRSDRLTQVSIDTSERFRSIQPRLESLLSERIVLYPDKQRIQPVQVAAQQKDDNNIEILLRYQRTNAVRLRLLSALLETLPLTSSAARSAKSATG